MKTLHKSKYLEIEFGFKSWGIGIDWEANKYTRPVYVVILCFCFKFGKDPWKGGEDE